MAPVFSILAALAMPVLSMAAAIPQDDASVAQIVGGTAASSGEFPYIISLQTSGGSHFCGGALYNGNTVITAAHCVRGRTPSSLRIRVGSLATTSGGSTSAVSSLTIHPSYSSMTLDNDVAVLRLATSIPAGGSIGYARLAASGSDPAAGSTTTVAGWGATSEGGGASSRLLKVSVPVISRSSCQASYASSTVSTNMFCAGLPEGGKDSCQGDSGGPIVDGSGTLIGVVSWGQGCARPNAPGVYTRLGNYVSFINSNAA